MSQARDDEAVWLRFFRLRLLVALRYAKVPATADILRELIVEVEARIEKLSKDDAR